MSKQITNRIRDLGLAAALISAGFDLEKHYEDMYGRAYFVFKQTKELDSAINEYRADTLKVRARKYSDNLKMLKSLIYAER